MPPQKWAGNSSFIVIDFLYVWLRKMFVVGEMCMFVSVCVCGGGVDLVGEGRVWGGPPGPPRKIKIS